MLNITIKLLNTHLHIEMINFTSLQLACEGEDTCNIFPFPAFSERTQYPQQHDYCFAYEESQAI
jgi:hypothetical protein